MYMTLPWQLMLVGIQEDSEKTPHTLQPAEDWDHQPGRRGEGERDPVVGHIMVQWPSVHPVVSCQLSASQSAVYM